MKYVFLAYRDKEQWEGLSPSERDTFVNACQINEQELQQSDHLFAVESQQSRNTTLTVRVLNGRVCLTNGFYAETAWEPVQLFFIEARDLNEAIQLAAKMPQARRGSIEVRTILDTVAF